MTQGPGHRGPLAERPDGHGRRTIRKVATAALVGVVATLGLAACGGGEESSGETSSSNASAGAETESAPLVLPTGKVKCGATELGDDPCLVPGKPPEGEQVNIAFFGLSGVDYTVAVQRAVERTAAENNATVDVFLNAFNPAEEIRQLQDAIAKNTYDAFIIEPVNPAGLKPLMKQLVAKDLPFSTWVLTNGTDDTTAKLQFEGQTLQTTRPPGSQSTDLAAGTVEACGDKNPCNVAHIRGLPVLPFDNVLTETFQAEIAKHPNIKILSTVNGQYTTDGARQAMQDLLQANPDVDVVATHSDGMTLGAERAVNAAGKKGVMYTSSGGGSYAVKAIKEDRWYSSALVLPENEGVLTTLAVIAAARGAEISAGIATIDTRGPLPSNLTKKNLPQWESFEGQYLGL